MNGHTIKQFAASFLVVLSLFVSSISACTCSSHNSSAVASEHCQPQAQQEHSHEAKTESHYSHEKTVSESHHHVAPETEAVSGAVGGQECCCIDAAPKVSVKSETIKTEKQAARLLSSIQVEIAFAPDIVSVKKIDFEPPFYLSDSFYNISPGRAPPRL